MMNIRKEIRKTIRESIDEEIPGFGRDYGKDEGDRDIKGFLDKVLFFIENIDDEMSIDIAKKVAQKFGLTDNVESTKNYFQADNGRFGIATNRGEDFFTISLLDDQLEPIEMYEVSFDCGGPGCLATYQKIEF